MGDKVINFSEGSKFYFELGNYYYQKNNLDEALSYYQRALAVDPANPVNHFNVACLLSELGKYRESSSIFQQIVTELDSDMSESWFWLAMNHGQLQQYKEAGQYLRKYLEQEPDGEYSWQAEEILDYMRSDLPMLSQGQRNKIDRLCTKGIELVNQGRLKEAIKCFTRASDIEPEMTAPRNNLALSWFYLGEMGKAIEMTQEILEREPANVFANCNLATFYYVVEDQLGVRRQVQILDGLWSEDSDEMIKLGTTYGLLGLDKKALAVFRFLYDSGFRSFELTLLKGITYYNCGNLSEAANFFSRLNEMEPDNPYRIYRYLCDRTFSGKIPYHLRIPEETIAMLLESEPGDVDLGFLRDSPELWPQLLWIIRNGSGVAREKLVQVISLLAHEPLIDLLIPMIWDQGIDIRCRKAIFIAFKDSDIQLWNQRYWNQALSKNAALALEVALESLCKDGHGFSTLNRAYSSWLSFWILNKPRIRNTDLWSAAVLVFVDGLDSVDKTAARFGVAPHGLLKAVKQLIGLCVY